MFDLSKQKVDVECPNCKKKHTATFQDVTNSKIIHCSCNTDIKLKDSNGSVRKSVSDINSAMKKLEQSLKSFGR